MTLVRGENSHHSARGSNFRVSHRQVARRVVIVSGTSTVPTECQKSYSLIFSPREE